jgi:large subunit ribosomal protein L29
MTMKIQAMLDWSPEEKAAKAKEWAQSLFTLRLQKATGQLENPMKIKELRKDIARLKTAQHMSAAEAAAAAAAAEEHDAAAHDAGAAPIESSEEHVSSKVKEAGATPKPKGHVTPAGKGAKKRAAAAAKATQKKTAAGPSKGHSPSKKSAGPKGKTATAPKAKSAPGKSSKKK